MNWFKRSFGLDVVDVLIQAAVTGLAMGFIDSTAPRPASEGMMMLAAGASVIVFAVRRHRALLRMGQEPIGLTTGQMAAERIEELESRVAHLESAETRLIELEERLDFTERMLAQGTGERASFPAADKR